MTVSIPENIASTPLSFFQRLTLATGVDTRMMSMVAALVLIWGCFWVIEPNFLTARNFWNLAVQSSVVAIMATGMVLVIVIRHIDLSVGSILGLVSMMAAVLQVQIFTAGAAWSTPVTIICCLFLGTLLGAWQGLWVAYLGVPSFVVTLGGLLVFRGLAWQATKGQTIAPMEDSFQKLIGGGIDGGIGAGPSWVVGVLAMVLVVVFTIIARKRRRRFGFPIKPMAGEIFMLVLRLTMIAGFVYLMNSYPRPGSDVGQGIPKPAIILITVVIIMEFIARMTRFGRYVFAIGGNPEAALLAGINTRRVTVYVFSLMGFLAGLAGLITTARLNAGANSAGELAELSVIAAAVIGGTSLAGGIGTITGAIIGAILMESLRNGMLLIGLPSPLQNVIIGFVLMFAVWADVVYQRRRAA
ncbi:MAG: sugar ABC transporter permease [Alphaproteobacteria bacterium]